MERKRGVVTVRNWVYTKDGSCYHALFGWVEFKKAEEVLGFRPGSGQANFIVTVGIANPIWVSGCEFVAFEQCDDLSGCPKDVYWVQ